MPQHTVRPESDMKQRDLSRRVARADHLIRERVHDPYKARRKLPEPTLCRQCGAVYSKGRWHWAEPPGTPNEALCQACHRINDDYPAGTVRLSGAFLAKHRREILSLIRRQEELEKGEHPLNRIMYIANEDGDMVITTTDIHLPQRIGEALHSAYKGELDFHYEEESYAIRLSWRRNA